MILYPLYNQQPNTEKVEEASPVALEFLQRIDEGKYAASWQSAAKLMKNKISEQDWVKKLTQARDISGPLLARERKDASFSTEAEDSPDGEYMMLTYSSSFAKANDVTEYVTVALEGSRWRVAGYFMEQ